MEKSPSSISTREGSPELQCVGELEIVKAKPAVGFLCGSIPVTDKPFTAFGSALVPSASTEGAPRYRVIPTETNLKTLPFRPNIPERVLPMVASHARTGGDLPNGSGTIASNLRRKGEALAVSGLTEHEDEIDVIAPADILKQIFKIPYSRAPISIAVHRIGQSLILNTGPDVEEGEKIVRHKQQSQCAEKSLFSNFAMHSVRMEACDLPPTQNSKSEERLKTSFLTGNNEIGEGEEFKCPQLKVKHDSFFLGVKNNQRNKDPDAVKKVSKVKETPRPSMQESDMYRRMNRDGFLRVLFWKFNNLRMFLGSDLLIFSNDKHVAVSLHLWDVSRQGSPLAWLEAWLDNVMASVPELAICYHENGVVQGYELLKTDDIFVSKGVSEDGTPAFHPHIVRQNGHSVLRFLQENCKQDPGAYWLYKNAGEDNIQLFDLSVIPKSHAANSCDDDSAYIPSLIDRGRRDSLLSLGTLLYRVAHRLSLSVSPHNRARCARLLKKCLDFLDQPDQLVVRAFAHEQFARLLLDYDEDLDLTSEVLPQDSEDIVVDAGHESDECLNGISNLIVHESISPNNEESTSGSGSRKFLVSNEADSGDVVVQPTCNSVVEANVDLISSKLAAIHHVSQAIKSLRWRRQLQGSESCLGEPDNHAAGLPVEFSVCACGDADCIEVCDIRKWLPKSKLDDKLWKLVLLLGESYLALGEAYIVDGQSHQALKVVRLACLVYGSMPQHLEDSRFISSMSSSWSSFEIDINDTKSIVAHYLFWAKAWTLVGDVYVEFHLENQKVKPPAAARDLKMSPQVEKEVQRLKKKLGKFNQSCSSCSLVNCSCQSDRASSGSSASSSSTKSTRSFSYGKKHTEKTVSKAASQNIKNENEDVKSCKDAVESDTLMPHNGGIFRYIDGYEHIDTDHNLTSALNCYNEAVKCLDGHPSTSSELQSLVKKKGWVCNELGRRRLERKEIRKAEEAFSEAITSFKKVSDHNNIILINLNLGHGRRSAAEELVSQMEPFRNHAVFKNTFNQKLDAAKSQYCESLRYYRAAKKQVHASDAIISDLSNDVYTQYAHTYLRLGMLLARENTTAKVYKSKMEFGKCEISASDAISEALCMYELLGDLRKQEAAYAYFQLACYQRDCVLRLLEMDLKKSNLLKGENNIIQKVKQFSSMAERNWRKSMQFYGPKTHSTMYLTILIQLADLSCSLSKSSNAYVMLKSAVDSLLEGRHVAIDRITLEKDDDGAVYERFWGRLQVTLKRMLSLALPAATNKSNRRNMEKSPSSISTREGSPELQCVGELEIVKAKPAVGFLCGSIPVTDKPFTAFGSALVPSASTEGAPRYRVIPTETNLKTLPFRPNIPERVLPMVASHARTGGDLPNGSGTIASNLRRKGEALAVSGLTEHEDEIDVIAPADILKQIFKIPYSRAPISIAVHRIGQSLILNTGPDVEEGEKIVRHKQQSQCAEKSLFSNFAMHSVRMEACDLPPTQNSKSEERLKTSFLTGNNEIGEGEEFKCPQLKVKHDSFFLGVKNNQRNKDPDAVKKVSKVKETPRPSMQESDMYRRMNRDGFLRVLFWKFNNLRMFLGSDLLIFSNDKHVAVSLHLWDVSRQGSPLAWLEAWLDNVMASVPELAICYHENGVVQGYELLKTDDIFVSKGVSEDGTPAFHPHIVRQNGHSVLRFLQENCKQDPGAYWLYKNAGEDNIQLFDLSVIPKSHAANSCDDDSAYIPSLIDRGRRDSLLSLGTLLYRVAHRLSLSVSPHNRARCARLLKKCLDFLDQPDQLVVRAFAHEQFARLLLDYDEDLDLTSEVLPQDSEDIVVDAGHESDECLNGISNLIVHESISPNNEESTSGSGSRKFLVSNEADSGDVVVQPTCNSVVEANVDLISSKLAAIHHVSQAIKSLRWRRQLQGSESCLGEPDNHAAGLPVEFSVCACGDADCIEVCDIRKWLPKSKLDDKLWKLVLLLGESYLALGEAYIVDGQSHQALKVVRLACLVYGSMPQHLEDSRFISSMSSSWSSFEIDINDTKSIVAHYLFWAKAWTLVGDVYVEFHLENQKVKPPAAARDLKMSPQVEKEVQRLKKKLGKFNQSCSSCSLVNCSCQSDRASSGSSASSSSTKSTRSFSYGKKHTEKTVSKAASQNIKNENEDVKSCKDAVESDTLMPHNGGIFRYIDGYEHIDTDHNLTSALNCYNEAVKCLDGHPSTSSELQSLVKKKGWVCNELGRRRLERKEIRKAEEAFSEAITSFKKVSDHNNIILINLNLGHGRRSAAEELVSQMEPFRNHAVFKNTFNQKLDAAKSQYCESLRYYRAAKKQVHASDAIISDLSNDVYTQYAHTYLRLGMLLARENTTAKVYKSKMEFGKCEISASDAISEALCMYELLGDLRKQEAAYAYFQLACYQRDCVLRLLEMDLKKSNLLKGENNIIQKVKQFSSMAERNWRKSMQFYGPKTHSTMYLTILIQLADLSCSLSKSSNAYVMLKSAVDSLLEGRHVAIDRITLEKDDDGAVYERFWGRLQVTLKRMLSLALPAATNKSVAPPQQTGDVKKLKEMYMLSLKATDLSQLHAIYKLWVS
ncbi:hypothetical protein SSX86_024863 [Deinandra increscens subsp. villosa]|uniref:EDRF1 N-terminal domain-containing protein n=1 Tax=Deinandra increscens subsp. villosa TaxID=3103831 RepID=A0AAP0GMP1_9ASTR